MANRPPDPNEFPPEEPEEDNLSDLSELRQLNWLTADMAEYNSRYSLGVSLSRLLMGAIDRSELSPEEQMLDNQESAAISAYDLMKRHAGVMNEAGLLLEPVVGKAGSIFHNQTQLDAAEVRLNVRDSGAFLAFLTRQTPEDVAASNADISLEQVARSLSQQVLDSYDVAQPRPEATELFGRLGGILDEYQRLSITGYGVKRLETYYIHGRRGDLREFATVEEEGLLNEPGKYFGPGDWQGDTTVEDFAGRWERALAVTNEIGRNPQAAELHNRVRSHLLRCIHHAQADLRAPSEYQSVEHRGQKLGILHVVQQQLQ